MKASRALSLLLALSLALFWISAAVALPIMARPWYYTQARSLELDKTTGWDYDTIFTAYDEVMDYLVYNAPFGTGELKWSEEGQAHFADCERLFKLDFALVFISAAALFGICFYLKKTGLQPGGLGSFNPAFWAAAVPTVLLTAIGAWAAADFDGFFTFFHKLCFPGKTNWIFNIYTDEIVLILPEAFWARTAALILVVALGGLWLTAALTKDKKKHN